MYEIEFNRCIALGTITIIVFDDLVVVVVVVVVIEQE
jgi:hypothetical protein